MAAASPTSCIVGRVTNGACGRASWFCSPIICASPPTPWSRLCEACGVKRAELRPDFERNQKAAQPAAAGTADCDCVNRGHNAIPLFRETRQRVAYAAPNWREAKGKGQAMLAEPGSWLIVAGGLLVGSGFIGLVFSPNGPWGAAWSRTGGRWSR